MEIERKYRYGKFQIILTPTPAAESNRAISASNLSLRHAAGMMTDANSPTSTRTYDPGERNPPLPKRLPHMLPQDRWKADAEKEISAPPSPGSLTAELDLFEGSCCPSSWWR